MLPTSPVSGYVSLKSTAVGTRLMQDITTQLVVNLKVPYDSLKQSGLTKDQAKELSKCPHPASQQLMTNQSRLSALSSSQGSTQNLPLLACNLRKRGKLCRLGLRLEAPASCGRHFRDQEGCSQCEANIPCRPVSESYKSSRVSSCKQILSTPNGQS